MFHRKLRPMKQNALLRMRTTRKGKAKQRAKPFTAPVIIKKERKRRHEQRDPL